MSQFLPSRLNCVRGRRTWRAVRTLSLSHDWLGSVLWCSATGDQFTVQVLAHTTWWIVCGDDDVWLPDGFLGLVITVLSFFSPAQPLNFHVSLTVHTLTSCFLSDVPSSLSPFLIPSHLTLHPSRPTTHTPHYPQSSLSPPQPTVLTFTSSLSPGESRTHKLTTSVMSLSPCHRTAHLPILTSSLHSPVSSRLPLSHLTTHPSPTSQSSLFIFTSNLPPHDQCSSSSLYPS